MNITGDDYRIGCENDIIHISGKLSLMLEDYADIEAFFENIVASKPMNLTLDIQNLKYLNSSGIKVLCVNLILEAADVDGLQLKILCSNRYTWQKETVPTFKDLMDNMVIEFV
jgi:hypothetical protein